MMNNVNLLPTLLQVMAECLLFIKEPPKFFETPTAFRGNNWKRSKIKEATLDILCKKYPELPKNALIEINERCAGSDADECHVHHEAHALILILGSEYGFSDPIGCCYQYKTKGTLPATGGIVFDIFPDCLHDFIASSSHSLFFLSIQTNWITDDDFELIP